MRKWWLWLILVLIILLFLVLPWVFGISTERKLKEFIGQINQSHKVRIELLNYQRGWFSSQAEFNVTVSPHQQLQIDRPNNSSADGHRFHLFAKLQQGPIMISQGKLLIGHNFTRFYLVDDTQTSNEQTNATNGDDEAIGFLFIKLNNNIHMGLNLPTHHFSSDLAFGQLDWVGIVLQKSYVAFHC